MDTLQKPQDCLYHVIYPGVEVGPARAMFKPRYANGCKKGQKLAFCLLGEPSMPTCPGFVPKDSRTGTPQPGKPLQH